MEVWDGVGVKVQPQNVPHELHNRVLSPLWFVLMSTRQETETGFLGGHTKRCRGVSYVGVSSRVSSVGPNIVVVLRILF